jgi:hypothetical protein
MKYSTTEGVFFMATVNFSVPEDVKNRFNQVFQNQNKSQIITELMKKAIEDQERTKRRVQAFEALLKIRAKQKPVSRQKINKARREGRS